MLHLGDGSGLSRRLSRLKRRISKISKKSSGSASGVGSGRAAADKNPDQLFSLNVRVEDFRRPNSVVGSLGKTSFFPSDGDDDDVSSSDCREDAAQDAVGARVDATRKPVVAAAENVDNAKPSEDVEASVANAGRMVHDLEPDVIEALYGEADTVLDPATTLLRIPVAMETGIDLREKSANVNNHENGIDGADDAVQVLPSRDEREHEYLEVVFSLHQILNILPEKPSYRRFLLFVRDGISFRRGL